MSTQIVTVNASLTQAPAPNRLQQTGAILSQGGTNTATGTLTPVSTLAAGQAILSAPKALSSITWTTNVATATTTAPHGWTTADVVEAVIAGATAAAYNGTFAITITGASTFTYPLVVNPGGSASVPGTVTLADEAELLSQLTTYFAGNGVVTVNVLELGEGTPAEGVTYLTTWLASALGTPSQQYAFLVPREWDNVTSFLTLLANNTAVNAKLYFYVTTTTANRAVYAAKKNVLAEVEAPSIPATEFTLASAFGTALKQAPSSSNPVSPLGYAPSFGTTAYPQFGNQAVFTELAAAFVGWIATGAEGGITGNILKQGLMASGDTWNFWYSTDWAQINMQLAISNEVINGSAGGPNPLWYNQAGINRLQNRALQVARQGISAGLGLSNLPPLGTSLPIATFNANYNAGLYSGQIVVNAEPFSAYTAENPNDYGIGRYAGLTCVWIPQEPFQNIVFNLNATTLLVGG